MAVSLLCEHWQYLQAEGALNNQDVSSRLGQPNIAAFLHSLALVAGSVSSPPSALRAALPAVINATADGLGMQCL